MLYENYEKRLKRLVKIRDFFYHTRFIWIGVFALTLGTIGTLVGTKGVVTKTEIVGVKEGEPAKFVYGEKIELNSDSFMGGEEPTYEWQKQGSDSWSEDAPTEPGVYYVRAKSKNAFGGFYYGEPKKVEIAPKQLQVTIDSISTYGQKPGIEVDGLSYQDYVSSWEVEYDDISKENPKVKLSSLTIFNKNGQDTTSFYTGYLGDFVEHSMKKIPLTIKTSGAEKVYDGKPLTYKDFLYDENELLDGDHLDADALLSGMTSSVTDYSGIAVKNAFDQGAVKILNAQGKDVSCHYAIRSDLGNLMITRRAITISSSDVSKVYDGKPIANFDPADPVLSSNDGLEIGGAGLALFSGDYIKAEFANTGKYHAGTYPNSFTYKICRMVGSEEVDVESNYDVSTSVGSLTIEKRPFSYRASDESFEFDGFSHTSKVPTYDETSLAEGDEVNFTPSSTVTSVSDGSIRTSFSVTFSKGGENRTNDYQVIGSQGNLSISKRPLTVKFHDLVNEYTGQAFTLSDSDSKYDLIGSLATAANHHLEITGKSIVDVGTIVDEPVVRVLDSADHDVTSEYDLTVFPGTMTVNPRSWSLSVNSLSGITFGDYGENGVNYDNSDALPTGLATGDELRPTWGQSVLHHTDGSGVKNAFGYSIYSSLRNKDVTNNYKALVDGENLSQGSISVNKKDITITPSFADTQKEYDGTPLKPTGVFASGLASGNRIENTYEFLNCPTDASDDFVPVSVNPSTIRIVTSTGIDVTDDYNITCEPVSVRVNKRSITCNLSKAIVGLDGNLTVTYSFSNLPASETVDAANLSWNNDGMNTTLDTSSVIIRNQSDAITTANYLIYSGSTSTETTQLSVRFAQTANSLSKVYDGDENPWDWLHPDSDGSDSSIGVRLTQGSLRPGDRYVVVGTSNSPLTSYTANTYTGQYTIHIYDGEDNLVDGLYNFNGTQNGRVNLTISKRALKVSTAGYTGTYDGLSHPSDPLEEGVGYSITEGSLASNDTLTRDTSTSRYITSGNVSDSATFSITHLDGSHTPIDVTGCYNLQLTTGFINISKRTLNLDFGTIAKEYDGVAYQASDFLAMLPVDLGLALGDELSLNLSNNILEPGTYSLSQYLSANVLRGLESRNDCYTIRISGSVTISKRSIVYSVGNVSRMYDGTFVDISSADLLEVSGTFLPGDHLQAINRLSGTVNETKTYVDAIGAKVVDSLGQDRSRYYDLSIDSSGYGDYTLQKAPLSFDLENVSVKLNNGTYSADTPAATNVLGAFGTDHIVVRQKSAPQVLPNQVGNHEWSKWLEISVQDSSGNDKTGLYDISVNGGWLTLENQAITIRVKDTTLDVGEEFLPAYDVIDNSALAPGHVIQVLFSGNSAAMRYEVGTLNDFEYSFKIIDTYSGADVSGLYDLVALDGDPTLTMEFPDVAFRLGPASYTYAGAVDKSTTEISRSVSITSGKMPPSYQIYWKFYADGSYSYTVLHSENNVTAAVSSHISVDDSQLPVEKPRQGFASLSALSIMVNNVNVGSPYGVGQITITNLPLAEGDSITDASFLYNGDPTITLVDNGSGEIQYFTFTVTLVSITISNSNGAAPYTIDMGGATATLTIAYTPTV